MFNILTVKLGIRKHIYSASRVFSTLRESFILESYPPVSVARALYKYANRLRSPQTANTAKFHTNFVSTTCATRVFQPPPPTFSHSLSLSLSILHAVSCSPRVYRNSVSSLRNSWLLILFYILFY